MSNVVKIAEAGRPVAAPEWALRRAMDIVARHIPDGDFALKSALAADIAEALYNTASPMMGGCAPIY